MVIMKNTTYLPIAIFFLLFLSIKVYPQMKEREDILPKYKWDLTPLFNSDEDWKVKKCELTNRIPSLSGYSCTITDSSKELAEALDLLADLKKDAARLWTYAILHSDQDTRVAQYQSMVEESLNLYNSIFSESSFIAPEILKLEETVLEDLIQENEQLEKYRFYLKDLIRRKDHSGSQEVEEMIANAGIMAENTRNIHNVLLNAELPYNQVTLSTGENVEMNQNNFIIHRTSTNREDRKSVFEGFFGSLKNFEKTIGTALYGNMKRDVFYAQSRNYNSNMESTLDEHYIPVELYHNLIKTANKNLDTFHRYLTLRKRFMGLEELHYYDLYAPIVEGRDIEYSLNEAQELVFSSLEPLGKKYLSTLQKAFDEKWIDFHPSKGKKAGAYSSGLAYDVHPYVLMNYNNKQQDLNTLTHELGHAMHTFYSNEHQPYHQAHYRIFVAEVASTFNEELLNNHLINIPKNKYENLVSMWNFLENAKSTFFRAVQFAEFELKIHGLAEKGEVLSGERLSEIYLAIARKYYGHEKGICIVDDNVEIEWAYINHFYRSFYQYQYATSFVASQALSEQVLSGKKGARENYLHFLTTGGSAYPIDLLKEAGVDLTNPEPYDITFQKMNKVMDEMEKILYELEE